MTETMKRTLVTDKQADIINVDSVRVTKTALRDAERIAKGDRLARLVNESVHALAIVTDREEKNLVSLVDSYRAVGDPIVVAVRDGLAKGLRAFIKIAENGETVPSGKYRNEPRYTRGYRIADSWADGETTTECVGRFLAWCDAEGKKVGISEFVSWIGGGNGSKPKTPEETLCAALRAFYRSGGSVDSVKTIAALEWALMVK